MKTRIILGISGGIAAYKTPELVRLLVKQEVEVHCILTESAAHFVTPLTLAALSGNPVLAGHFETLETGKIQHIELAEKAELLLIAPATANVIAKTAHGIGDDLLTSTVLAAQGNILICPAMNVFMWENPATQENMKILRSRGIEILEPTCGELACGYEATGRMMEPAEIAQAALELLSRKQLLKEKRFLITAGPTREFLDPVRFLSNPSSGKMGYALAKAARHSGAQVVLVSGPTELIPPYGVSLVRVTSGEEMQKAVEMEFPNCDIFISAAAVSDWKAKKPENQKIKKNEEELLLTLLPVPDILSRMARQKKHQILVGFAAETENLAENAKQKLTKKNLDLIVGNSVNSNGFSAFESEENEITLFFPSGERKSLPRMSKLQAAYTILDVLAEKFFNLKI